MAKTQTKFIADAAVTLDKLNTNVAGNGITGGAGTALAVEAKANSGIVVDADGVAAAVDGATTAFNGSGQIYIPEDGIGATQINQAANFVWTGIHNLTGATVTVPTITGLSGANAPTTKNYVDGLIEGLAWKSPVVVATVEDITLSGEQTIDDVAVSAGDRVLVKDQSTTAENGIYEASTTAWVRAADADTGPELVGAAIMVVGGTTHANQQFVQTEPTITIGSTPVTFIQFGGGQAYVAGTGLLLTANTFSVRMGAGLTELPEGEVGVDVLAAGGLTVGAGLSASQLAINPDTTTGATVVPVAISTNGTGVAIDNTTIEHATGTLSVKDAGIGEAKLKLGSAADQIDSTTIPVDTGFTPANYTPDGEEAGITAHLAGIDEAIAGVSLESFKQTSHTISAGEQSAGYIDISGWANIPVNAQSVRVTPVGGPEQANYSVVGGAVTPDFEVNLASGSERIIFRNAGSPSVTLTEDLGTGDVLMISYIS